MNVLKERIKSKGFWISLSSAVIVFLQCLGIKINQPKVDLCITAFFSILFVLGIISEEKTVKSNKSGGDIEAANKEDNKEDNSEEN